MLAAVELDADGLIVLGQMAAGVQRRRRRRSGFPVELVVEPLFETDEAVQLVWRWMPAGRRRPPVPDNAVVLGVGMTAWGKWGRPFVDYGTAAAREALDDAGVDWTDVDLIVGGETVRNGYAGYVAGSTVAAALGFSGTQVATVYGACASGAMAIDHGRAHIMAGLADVVLVVGADTTPKGFLAPNAGERPDDPDWLRFRLLGATNPAYFGLYARRRMHLYGATESDFAKVKVKNSRHGVDNPRARYRKEVAEEEVLASPIVALAAPPARHLRHLRRRRRRRALLGRLRRPPGRQRPTAGRPAGPHRRRVAR